MNEPVDQRALIGSAIMNAIIDADRAVEARHWSIRSARVRAQAAFEEDRVEAESEEE